MKISILVIALILSLTGCAPSKKVVIAPNKNIAPLEFVKYVAEQRKKNNHPINVKMNSPCNAEIGYYAGVLEYHYVTKPPKIRYHYKEKMKELSSDLNTYCTDSFSGITMTDNSNDKVTCLNQQKEIFSYNFKKIITENDPNWKNGDIIICLYMPYDKNLYQTAENFLKRIIVIPEIIDQSELYDGVSILKIEKSHNVTCEIENKQDIVGKVSIIPDYNNNMYKTEILNNSYTVKYSENDAVLKPKVIIHAARSNKLYPKVKYANQDLELNVKKLNINNTSVICSLEIINKTSNYISLNAVSLYLCDGILSRLFNDHPKEIPPGAIQITNIIDFCPNNAKKCNEFIKIINNGYTLGQAKSQKVSIGFSAKYQINSTYKTLFNKSTTEMSKLVKN